MRAIVGCERSGIVRDALRALGNYAVSCDLEDCERDPEYHFKGDLLSFLLMGTHTYGYWRLGIFHPECRYLSSSGLHWNHRVPGREAETAKALKFVEKLLRAPIHSICVENPRGCITTRLAHVIKELGYVRQSIQPYNFGDDASKETILLLKNLPPLEKTNRVAGRMVEWPKGSGKMVERWSNQTDSGQNKLSPSKTRAMDRARTYPGVAAAMARQWTTSIGFA